MVDQVGGAPERGAAVGDVAGRDVAGRDVAVGDVAMALAAVVGRRSVPALESPAPDDAQLEAMIDVACTAPDHGRLRPWRFVVVRGEARSALGAAFSRAQAARDPRSGAAELERAASRPLRAPVIVVVIARPVDHPTVEAWEQLIAVGCAAQNLCIAATAHGYGSMWRTGWYTQAPEVRDALDLDDPDHIVGFVYLGTPPAGHRVPPRPVEQRPVTWRG